MELEDLVSEVSGHRARSVILTGGEPTLVRSMPELIAALKAKGFWIAVETNGTVAADWLAFVDYVACSPKRGAALELREANEVRIVAEDAETSEFCREVRARVSADDYYVSPCDHDGQIDFATAKEVLGRLSGWSLSVQLHKLLGFK